MKRSRKSKSISWAPGVNLCQVKLFLSEDCPSKVGAKSQDNLQAKASWMVHPSAMEFNNCPPGFESSHLVNQSKDVSNVPMIEWKCPPKFVMSCNWRVAAGDESKETEFQKLRERRVLEAVYPRNSSIPPSPSVSLDVENEPYHSSHTPSVPITPIEEESFADIPSDSAAQGNIPLTSQPILLRNSMLASATVDSSTCPTPALEPALAKLPDVGADVMAAASAALAVLMKSNEQGSMIDTDLLIKILSDPKMIERLSDFQGAEATSGIAPVNVVSKTSTSQVLSQSASMSIPKPDKQASPNGRFLPNELQPTSIAIPTRLDKIPVSGLNQPAPSGPDPKLGTMPMAANGSIYTVPNQRSTLSSIPKIQISPVSSTVVKEAQHVKDINYYKNLIRQHGEQQETMDHILAQNGNRQNLQDLKLVQNIKSGNLIPKNQKPCIYYKSSKGCRNGVHCPYRHDTPDHWRSGTILESQSAKRVKLGGEITGV